jgi:hypothetical protein
VDQAAEAAVRAESVSPERSYVELARVLGGLDPRTRGAGTVTAALSLWIASKFQDRPEVGLRLCAETLGSDTDTIATMAGALLGAVSSYDPPGALLDRRLIASEAIRLESLAAGEDGKSFPHPDPMRWQPPASLSDALGLIDDTPAIAGLGPVELLGESITGQGKQPGIWQWVRTAYGQQVLIKRRSELKPLPETAFPRTRAGVASRNGNHQSDAAPSVRPHTALPTNPDEGLALLLREGMPDDLLGRLTRHYALRGSMQAAVFATLVSAALREVDPKSDSGT